MHKGLICFYSDYFDRAFNGAFKEASDKSVSLPNECQHLFAIFRGWLYTRELRDADDRVAQNLPCDVLVKLWVLGDKYLVPLLQNHVVDIYRLKDLQMWSPQMRFLPYVYANTPPDSILRSLVISLIVLKGSTDVMNACNEAFWTKESLMDYIKAQRPH